MAVFPFPWDGTFDSEPADDENINLGALRIRDTRNAVQARMQVDHSWSGNASDGLHIKSEYILQNTDPTLNPNDGAVYVKSVGGNSELFYKDGVGNVIQLTSLGHVPSGFPSGTQMLFMQAAPPSGWVQNVAFNDVMVRVVNNNSGGGMGGNWVISGLNGVTDSHVLVVGEIPTHTHNTTVPASSSNTLQGLGGGIPAPSTGAAAYISDGGTGGGAGHTHTITGGITGNGTWRPAYINSCIGVKS